MSGATDEDALIEAVIRVRAEDVAESAAQVMQVLEKEGMNLTLSQVKKACSKASKRVGPAVAAAAPAVSQPPITSQPSEKTQARQAKLAAAELKAAETAMMDAQRKLRAAKAGDISAPVTISGTAEAFIQQATSQAITGTLQPGDSEVLKERIEADIAALEWVKLAAAAGVLSLTEDVVALGGELQLTRLKEVRGGRDISAARAVFVDTPQVQATPRDGAALDRMLARSAPLTSGQQTLDAMEDID